MATKIAVGLSGVEWCFSNEFDESKHPRDEHGRFAETAEFAGKRGMVPIVREGDKPVQRGGKSRMAGGRWVLKGGGELPGHLKGEAAIPPAWRAAYVNPDPKADYVAVGVDEKGRLVKNQSRAFVERQKADKFERVQELKAKRDKVLAQTAKDCSSSDPETRETASCMRLVQATGIRPGSEKDTGADKRAYGATTLEGRHVVEEAGGVRLRFTGKKGVALDIPVEDKAVAADLLRRKEAAGPDGKLFDTTDTKLQKYSHTLDGGSFKPKDFRTLKGTVEAASIVAAEPKPKTFADYKRRVMEVARRVAARLGNTPAVALENYIHPSVFAPWKAAAAH